MYHGCKHVNSHIGCAHCRGIPFVQPSASRDNCAKDTRQHTVQILYFLGLVGLICFIVVGSLAALEVLRQNVSPLDVVGDVEIYLRPHDWFWAGFIVFWIWLALGISIAWKASKRSDASEFVFRGIWQFIVGIFLWSGAVFAWIFDESHIVAMVVLVVAFGFFCMSMASLYLSNDKNVPTFNVYLFWIASHAFAVGWTLSVLAFVVDAVFQRHWHGANAKMVASLIYIFLILVPGVVFGILVLSWAFLLPIVMYTVALPVLSGTESLYTNSDPNDTSLLAVVVTGLFSLSVVFICALYVRIWSKNLKDGLALFRRRRRKIKFC
jgi:hypothetical protein